MSAARPPEGAQHRSAQHEGTPVSAAPGRPKQARPAARQDAAFVSARLLCAALLMALAGPSWAGRPLTVDDANTADVGDGQVETWVARQGDRSKTWTTAVGVGVFDGVELGASFARNMRMNENASALQAKLRLTPSVEGGCNLAAVLGMAHTHGGVGRAHYLNGIATCNLEAFTLHGNLGASRVVHGGSTLKTWGVAAEKAFGDVTAHLEYFGQQQSKPTLQAGLRTEIMQNVQLDGSVGRAERQAVFSVGLKFSF